MKLQYKHVIFLLLFLKIIKRTLLFLLFIVTISISNKAEARGVVVYHNGPTYNIAEKLPSDCEIDGEHVNLAVMYKQFGLFWLPVWNYGTPEYILLSDNENDYWNIDKETLDSIKTTYNLSISDEPSPSLWNKIGLKPVIIILVILIFGLCLVLKQKRMKKK